MSDISKTVLLSGKLNGTKTFGGVLDEKENLDGIELFLKELYNLKIVFSIDNEVIYINDDQDFLNHVDSIGKSQFISIYTNDTLSRLYITTDERKTFVIRLNKVSSIIIAKFISEETPIKFSLNSFNFIKWCVKQKIDMGNIYDIPTYIKILTNEVDPFKTADEYLKRYTDYELEQDENERNGIIIGNFIYEFGKFLLDNAKKFGIDTLSKLINENSYYEALSYGDDESCIIRFSYKNLMEAISEVLQENEEKFKDKVYVVSPLGRIAIKFGHNVRELIEELYCEDIAITILNELYNNNIHVKFEENSMYAVSCKYKNLGIVFSLVTAILNDVFYTMFKQSFEIKVECDIKA